MLKSQGIYIYIYICICPSLAEAGCGEPPRPTASGPSLPAQRYLRCSCFWQNSKILVFWSQSDTLTRCRSSFQRWPLETCGSGRWEDAAVLPAYHGQDFGRSVFKHPSWGTLYIIAQANQRRLCQKFLVSLLHLKQKNRWSTEVRAYLFPAWLASVLSGVPQAVCGHLFLPDLCSSFSSNSSSQASFY